MVAAQGPTTGCTGEAAPYNRPVIISPRLAANLSFLFTERPFLERFAAARAAGFTAVEFHFPYAEDPAVLAELALRHGLEVVLFNLPAGDWAAGERGIACHPGRIAEFRAGVSRALEYASALDCPRLNCLAGIPPPGVGVEAALATLADNLRHAAAACAAAGVQLLLEPLNTRDNSGFLISTTRDALAAIDAAGGGARLQYDVYHAQVMEGDLAATLATHFDRIGHIQIADNPGRHEPGTGEINYPFLFAHLRRLGYAGWVGCEYRPSGASEDSFGWIEACR